MTAGGALYTWGQGAAGYTGSQVPGGLGNDELAKKLVPTLVPRQLLGGARVGRCHGLREELALAFAMGTHDQLGAGSAAAGGGGGRRRKRRAQGKAPATGRGGGMSVPEDVSGSGGAGGGGLRVEGRERAGGGGGAGDGGAEDAGRNVRYDRELCEDVETAPEPLGSCASGGRGRGPVLGDAGAYVCYQ